MLRALPHTQGADRERVLLAVKTVAKEAETNKQYAGCLYELAAELVRYLPSSEQHAAVDRLLEVVESKQLGWVFSAEVVRAVGGFFDREQVARLERYVSGQTHCCIGVKVHAILANSGRFPAEHALKAARACEGMCGDGTDVLALLPLVDARSRAEFLAPELKRFEEPPESWSAHELHLLARIAPYVEEKRRHELLVVAFRRMPELGVEEDHRAGWGELAPPAHYHFVLVRLAPFVSPDLLPSALYSLPREWAPEVRSLVLGHFAASLRPEVRSRSLPTILDALPNAADDLHYVSARLLLAGDLPDAQVLKLFRRFLEVEERPYERAGVSAGLLGVSRGKQRTEIEQSFFRELERVDSSARRAELLATAIESAGSPA